jgi:hypothetical protein
MIDAILAWFANGWEWFRSALNVVNTAIANLGATLKGLLVLVAAAGLSLYRVIVAGFDAVWQKLSTAAAGFVDGSTLDSPVSGIVTLFENVNFFFPLSEALAMMAGLFALWVAIGIYRFVIALIPTLG